MPTSDAGISRLKMKKPIYLIFTTSIGLTFFLIMFTIIRKFYYDATLVLQEYIFPLVIGTVFGAGIGWWRIQTNEHKENLEKLTDELKISNARLRHKNKELIETQDRLRNSEKIEAIGLVAGGVAHDLNNILSAVINYPELILQNIQEDSPIKPYIHKIKKSAEKAAAIIQDLLTLARRGVQPSEIVNLKQTIEQYLFSPECDMLRSFHPNVVIETKFQDGVTSVKGSSVHLYKTVMNLVSNAAEAMPNGGLIKISLETRYINCTQGKDGQTLKGNYTILAVSDTGVGIDKDDLARIFEPFFTKKKMGRSGTGLGMAVVWGTIQDHDGYIDVQSEKNQGTIFKIYFPAIAEKDNSVDEKHFLIEEHMGKGEHILIVDDMVEQREIATLIAENLGYRTASVSSGEEAIEYLKERDVDIMLLDLILGPGVDGLETCELAFKCRPNIKVLLVSGYSRPKGLSKLQRLGAVDYLQKPFTFESISKALNSESRQFFRK